MKKSKASKPAAKSKAKSTTDAEYHRRLAEKHSATARIHSAKADLIEADNPKRTFGRNYPC